MPEARTADGRKLVHARGVVHGHVVDVWVEPTPERSKPIETPEIEEDDDGA